MKDPLGSVVESAKAVDGLGNAPRSWWLSVNRFQTSQNGHGDTNRSDTFGGPRTTNALVSTYVDDLIITGIPGQDVDNLKLSLRERFRWGWWKTKGFALCGVPIDKKDDHVIVLDQLSYANTGIDLISGGNQS